MIDEKTTREALRRLKRVEGQVKGIQRMVEEGRYCIEILDQISAIQGALDQVGKMVTKRHLESCVTEAFKTGSRPEREKKIGELMEVVSRFGR